MKSKLVDGLAQCGIGLKSGEVESLGDYLNELLRWNKKINLTAITDYNEAVEKHLIDSLLILSYIEDKTRLIDIGSGAGLPGIPLSIVRPNINVVSVDSVGKKINFQKHIKRMLNLKNFSPINSRIEKLFEVDGYEEGFDVVTARAFTSLLDIGQIAKKLLNSKGRVLAMKGAEGEKELTDAQQSLNEMGYVSTHVDFFRLPFTESLRTIITLNMS
jgi:16S rRNA (guanine527-N7)-methyltransferase